MFLSLNLCFSPIARLMLFFLDIVSFNDIVVHLILHNLHKLLIARLPHNGMAQNQHLDPHNHLALPQFLKNKLRKLMSLVAVCLIFAAVCGWLVDADIDLVVVGVL